MARGNDNGRRYASMLPRQSELRVQCPSKELTCHQMRSSKVACSFCLKVNNYFHEISLADA